MATLSLNKLRVAVNFINAIDDGKLGLLATRIGQHIIGRSKGGPFSEDELVKLESSLEMHRANICDVVNGIEELLLEAAYHDLSQNELATNLLQLSLDKAKIAALASVWAKAANAITTALKKKSVLPQLSYVAHNVSVEAGSKEAALQKNIRAHLQLGINSGDSTDDLNMEFSHEELSYLHSQLSRIQAQLDAIADK